MLDVLAESTVKDYDVTARVTGPLRETQISISSRPELAEIDVLALLTFGFTQQELQEAGNAGAGAGAFDVKPGWFWGLVDDSRFKLQSTLVDTGGAGAEQRVEWEKRFDNDVRFRFVWKKEESGAGGQASENGDFGMDAWYRWEL